MAESDLLELAARGRVTFHEPNEYILWQGEPHRHQVFVIQQGTVSLWDESAAEAQLRDVRGAGDLLGIERFNGAPVTPVLRALGERRADLRLPGKRFRAAPDEVSGRGTVRRGLRIGRRGL